MPAQGSAVILDDHGAEQVCLFQLRGHDGPKRASGAFAAKTQPDRSWADGLVAECRAFRNLNELKNAGLTVAVLKFNGSHLHIWLALRRSRVAWSRRRFTKSQGVPETSDLITNSQSISAKTQPAGNILTRAA